MNERMNEYFRSGAVEYVVIMYLTKVVRGD